MNTVAYHQQVTQQQGSQRQESQPLQRATTVQSESIAETRTAGAGQRQGGGRRAKGFGWSTGLRELMDGLNMAFGSASGRDVVGADAH